MPRRKTSVPKKRSKAKAGKRKKAPVKKAVRKRAVKEDPEEVARLFDQLQAEEKSEKAWKAMVEPESEDGEEWQKKEQHLQKKPDRRRRKETRWKYFGK